MALTPITMTGSTDTIKEGFTRVNDIIDDLAAVTTGLGASCIGVFDTAGNMAATNVEAALAEVYTDVTSARTLSDIFDENAATTTGLTWGWKGGAIRVDNTVTAVAADTISVTDDSVNYIEISQVGVVSRNGTGFTAGRIPIRQITAAGGIQTVSTDKRAWFVQVAAATDAISGTVELAIGAETRTGTDANRAVTPDGLNDVIGQADLVAGDIPYCAVATILTRLAKGAAGALLGMNDADTAPEYKTLKVTTAGIMTNAGQPIVLAKSAANQADVTGDGTAVTLICGTEIFDVGDGYVAETGIFTASVTGKHRLTTQVHLAQLAAAHNVHQISFVTSNRTYTKVYNFSAAANPFIGENDMNLSVLADMDVSDNAYVSIAVSGGTKIVDIYGDGGTTMYSFFSAELIC